MAIDEFQAYRLHAAADGERPDGRMEAITIDDLSPGDTLVKVAYAGLNYKDALAMAGLGRIVLFTTRGATPLHDFRFRPDDVLLFGRESAGVPDEVHDAADARVIIPLSPGRRSFNVTVSAAIGLSEALRQTGLFPNAVSP